MFEVYLFFSISLLLSASIWAVARSMAWAGRSTQVDWQRLLLLLFPVGFVLANLLYVLPLSVRLLFTTEVEGDIAPDLQVFIEYFPLAISLDALFIVVFCLIYWWSVRKYSIQLQTPRRIRRLPHWAFYLTWIAFFGVSIFQIYMLSRGMGGVARLILSGYRVTESLVGQGHFAIGLSWYGSLVLFLIVYARMAGHRVAYLTGFGLLALYVVALILMGRRAALVGVGIPLVLAIHLLFRKLTLKSIVILIVIGFIGLNILGVLRGGSYSSFSDAAMALSERRSDLSSQGRLNYFYTLTSGNFVQPFQALPNVIARNASGEIDYFYGASIFRGLTFIVPQALWPDRPEPVSNWYMKKFIDSNANDNEGRQFFFLADGYMNFGVFGSVIWGVLYGLIFSGISVAVVRRIREPAVLTFFALMIGNILTFVSADLSGALVVFMKVTAAPCLLFILAPRILRSR